MIKLKSIILEIYSEASEGSNQFPLFALYRWTPINDKAMRIWGVMEGYLYSQPTRTLQLIGRDGKALKIVWTHDGRLDLLDYSPQTIEAGKKAYTTAANEGFKFIQSGELQRTLDDISRLLNDLKSKWGWKGADPGQTYNQYKNTGRTKGKSSEEATKKAIELARKNGPTPEFRALFGGIKPELVGTTSEKVNKFAETLGIKYVEPKT